MNCKMVVAVWYDLSRTVADCRGSSDPMREPAWLLLGGRLFCRTRPECLKSPRVLRSAVGGVNAACTSAWSRGVSLGPVVSPRRLLRVCLRIEMTAARKRDEGCGYKDPRRRLLREMGNKDKPKQERMPRKIKFRREGEGSGIKEGVK